MHVCVTLQKLRRAVTLLHTIIDTSPAPDRGAWLRGRNRRCCVPARRCLHGGRGRGHPGLKAASFLLSRPREAWHGLGPSRPAWPSSSGTHVAFSNLWRLLLCREWGIRRKLSAGKRVGQGEASSYRGHHHRCILRLAAITVVSLPPVATAKFTAPLLAGLENAPSGIDGGSLAANRLVDEKAVFSEAAPAEVALAEWQGLWEVVCCYVGRRLTPDRQWHLVESLGGLVLIRLQSAVE